MRGGFARAGYAFALHRVRAVAEPRRVHEIYPHAVALHAPLHRVAGGAGDGSDDGSVVAEKGVEQRGLAGVGLAGQHRRYAVLRHPAALCGGEQRSGVRERFADAPFERGQHFVLGLFGVIQHGFQPRHDREQPVCDEVYPPRHAAVHQSVRRAQSRRALGVYHVGDAFRVGKIHPAREERAPGELPSLRRTRALFQALFERAAHYPDPAVQIKFHRILARVSAIGGEKDRVAAVAEIFGDEIAEYHGHGRGSQRVRRAPALLSAAANENGIRYRPCVLAGHAYDADAACSRGCGYSRDGVHFFRTSSCRRNS